MKEQKPAPDYEVRSDQMVLRIGQQLICPTIWKYEAPIIGNKEKDKVCPAKKKQE